MGRRRGEPGEIELTAIGVELNGSWRVRLALAVQGGIVGMSWEGLRARLMLVVLPPRAPCAGCGGGCAVATLSRGAWPIPSAESSKG